ncbi:2-polyprenyl-6-methoxyphenol hydroxylase [Pseudomonas alcaligenes]|uniref:2-polyprenyl-6-methoxyphenol hydroxylase n=1 Tax=Aquipseudomonas alcaligenes TaxID=43263 RepID=A0ABR7S7K7_AQUAC|nr:FAD-dependent monooxygenase [Pseudomonas alcaligenes]MBC9252825.1 2-polyprenyl-6-methoxyphenol hydroxylase [Pseudomonas alcaligenes]
MRETPVLISGGGPVGLVLALSLSRLGVRSLLVNDRKHTTTHPKLDVVNCRSMELFRQLGLAEKVRAAGNPDYANQYCSIAASANGPVYGVLSDQHLMYQPVDAGRRLIEACTDGALPLEPMQRIAQINLEPVLFSEAQADPNIDVRFGWRLVDFTQDASGVSAVIESVDGGAPEQVRAQYIAGCDGPKSRVRTSLGISYDGTPDLVGELFIVHFRSDELAKLYPNNEPYWHTWIARPGYSGLLVSPDASRNDYVLHRPFAPRPGETLKELIDQAIGTKVEYEIVQSGPWRPQFLVSEKYMEGRAFIVGDAAHQYMPTGGLGMNTGVAEAHNLAWKLAACIQGWGGRALLTSYESERLPIGRRNRDHVKVNAATVFEVQFGKPEYLLEDSSRGAQARLQLSQELERKVSRLYESFGVEIGYIYRDSPVIVRDQAPEPIDDTCGYVPTTWSGARLPSGMLEDGTAVFDHLSYGAFSLLVCNAEPEEYADLLMAARHVDMPINVVEINSPNLIALYERKLILVRPDQHVCWRGDSLPSDCSALVNRVRGA